MRWYQLRILRKEYRPVADFEATLARVLSMVRDRMLSLPDHLPELTGQRNGKSVRQQRSATHA